MLKLLLLLLLLAVPLAAQETPAASPIGLPEPLVAVLQGEYGLIGPPLKAFCAYGERIEDNFIVDGLKPWPNCAPERFIGMYLMLPQQPPGVDQMMIALSCSWVDELRRRTANSQVFAVVVYARVKRELKTALCFTTPASVTYQ